MEPLNNHIPDILSRQSECSDGFDEVIDVHQENIDRASFFCSQQKITERDTLQVFFTFLNQLGATPFLSGRCARLLLEGTIPDITQLCDIDILIFTSSDEDMQRILFSIQESIPSAEIKHSIPGLFSTLQIGIFEITIKIGSSLSESYTFANFAVFFNPIENQFHCPKEEKEFFDPQRPKQLEPKKLELIRFNDSPYSPTTFFSLLLYSSRGYRISKPELDRVLQAFFSECNPEKHPSLEEWLTNKMRELAWNHLIPYSSIGQESDEDYAMIFGFYISSLGFVRKWQQDHPSDIFILLEETLLNLCKDHSLDRVKNRKDLLGVLARSKSPVDYLNLVHFVSLFRPRLSDRHANDFEEKAFYSERAYFVGAQPSVCLLLRKHHPTQTAERIMIPLPQLTFSSESCGDLERISSFDFTSLQESFPWLKHFWNWKNGAPLGITSPITFDSSTEHITPESLSILAKIIIWLRENEIQDSTLKEPWQTSYRHAVANFPIHRILEITQTIYRSPISHLFLTAAENSPHRLSEIWEGMDEESRSNFQIQRTITRSFTALCLLDDAPCHNLLREWFPIAWQHSQHQSRLAFEIKLHQPIFYHQTLCHITTREGTHYFLIEDAIDHLNELEWSIDLLKAVLENRNRFPLQAWSLLETLPKKQLGNVQVWELLLRHLPFFIAQHPSEKAFPLLKKMSEYAQEMRSQSWRKKKHALNQIWWMLEERMSSPEMNYDYLSPQNRRIQHMMSEIDSRAKNITTLPLVQPLLRMMIDSGDWKVIVQKHGQWIGLLCASLLNHLEKEAVQDILDENGWVPDKEMMKRFLQENLHISLPLLDELLPQFTYQELKGLDLSALLKQVEKDPPKEMHQTISKLLLSLDANEAEIELEAHLNNPNIWKKVVSSLPIEELSFEWIEFITKQLCSINRSKTGASIAARLYVHPNQSDSLRLTLLRWASSDEHLCASLLNSAPIEPVLACAIRTKNWKATSGILKLAKPLTIELIQWVNEHKTPQMEPILWGLRKTLDSVKRWELVLYYCREGKDPIRWINDFFREQVDLTWSQETLAASYLYRSSPKSLSDVKFIIQKICENPLQKQRTLQWAFERLSHTEVIPFFEALGFSYTDFIQALPQKQWRHLESIVDSFESSDLARLTKSKRLELRKWAQVHHQTTLMHQMITFSLSEKNVDFILPLFNRNLPLFTLEQLQDSISLIEEQAKHPSAFLKYTDLNQLLSEIEDEIIQKKKDALTKIFLQVYEYQFPLKTFSKYIDLLYTHLGPEKIFNSVFENPKFQSPPFQRKGFKWIHQNGAPLADSLSAHQLLELLQCVQESRVSLHDQLPVWEFVFKEATNRNMEMVMSSFVEILDRIITHHHFSSTDEVSLFFMKQFCLERLGRVEEMVNPDASPSFIQQICHSTPDHEIERGSYILSTLSFLFLSPYDDPRDRMKTMSQWIPICKHHAESLKNLAERNSFRKLVSQIFIKWVNQMEPLLDGELEPFYLALVLSFPPSDPVEFHGLGCMISRRKNYPRALAEWCSQTRTLFNDQVRKKYCLEFIVHPLLSAESLMSTPPEDLILVLHLDQLFPLAQRTKNIVFYMESIVAKPGLFKEMKPEILSQLNQCIGAIFKLNANAMMENRDLCLRYLQACPDRESKITLIHAILDSLYAIDMYKFFSERTDTIEKIEEDIKFFFRLLNQTQFSFSSKDPSEEFDVFFTLTEKIATLITTIISRKTDLFNKMNEKITTLHRQDQRKQRNKLRLSQRQFNALMSSYIQQYMKQFDYGVLKACELKNSLKNPAYQCSLIHNNWDHCELYYGYISSESTRKSLEIMDRFFHDFSSIERFRNDVGTFHLFVDNYRKCFHRFVNLFILPQLKSNHQITPSFIENFQFANDQFVKVAVLRAELEESRLSFKTRMSWIQLFSIFKIQMNLLQIKLSSLHSVLEIIRETNLDDLERLLDRTLSAFEPSEIDHEKVNQVSLQLKFMRSIQKALLQPDDPCSVADLLINYKTMQDPGFEVFKDWIDQFYIQTIGNPSQTEKLQSVFSQVFQLLNNLHFDLQMQIMSKRSENIALQVIVDTENQDADLPEDVKSLTHLMETLVYNHSDMIPTLIAILQNGVPIDDIETIRLNSRYMMMVTKSLFKAVLHQKFETASSSFDPHLVELCKMHTSAIHLHYLELLGYYSKHQANIQAVSHLIYFKEILSPNKKTPKQLLPIYDELMEIFNSHKKRIVLDNLD